MIDWANLAFNALWVLACAIFLAALSYASWEASLYKVKMRERLRLPGYQTIFNLAAVLFCAGLAGLADNFIIRIVWIILAVLSLIFAILSWKAPKAEQPPQPPPESH
jgi:hypothetical protein